MKMNKNIKLMLVGGAGLVGQNLVARLILKGFDNIYVIDKHENNLKILKNLHPNVSVLFADISIEGKWQEFFTDVNPDVVVMLQAQIGGLFREDFINNNVTSTQLILNLMRINSTPYLIHISSSVVESSSVDFYTETKKLQERLVINSGINNIVLRPTLMFGWFDRKHLGWLSRLMKRTLVFPIPGSGKYPRQPLYVGDFCNIIISCIDNNNIKGVYNISGFEKINYIDIIKSIKKITNSRTLIVKVPFYLFYLLLYIWSLFDRNPPFTINQLNSLVANDEFEVINWNHIFGVQKTSFTSAINETFNHPIYSKIILEF